MISRHLQERMHVVAHDPLVTLVRKSQPEGQWQLYLVGGAIRDMLLDRPLVDRDFVVIGDTMEFTKRLAARIGAKHVPLEEHWDMVRLVIAQPGKGGKKSFSYLDFSGLRGNTIDEDLLHRDFTINAMAIPVFKGDRNESASLHDPAHGIEDLEKGIIRAISSSNLEADPVRILRAFRFGSVLGFSIDPETERALALHATKIHTSAGERIQDELLKVLNSQYSSRAFEEMESAGLLRELFPELTPLKGLDQGTHHGRDAWHHALETLRAVESISERQYADFCPWDLAIRNDLAKNTHTLPLLKMAALLHDIGKPSTKSIGNDGEVHFYGHEREGARMTLDIAKRLRLSRLDQNALWTLVRHHMWPLHMYLAESHSRLTDRARIRFFRRLGMQALGIIVVSIADDRAKQSARQSHEQNGDPLLDFSKSLLSSYYDKDAGGTKNPPLLTGHDLIQQFGLKPGPRIGQILEAIHEARVGGKVNDRKDALEYARSLIRPT